MNDSAHDLLAGVQTMIGIGQGTRYNPKRATLLAVDSDSDKSDGYMSPHTGGFPAMNDNCFMNESQLSEIDKMSTPNFRDKLSSHCETVLHELQDQIDIDRE